MVVGELCRDQFGYAYKENGKFTGAYLADPQRSGLNLDAIPMCSGGYPDNATTVAPGPSVYDAGSSVAGGEGSSVAIDETQTVYTGAPSVYTAAPSVYTAAPTAYTAAPTVYTAADPATQQPMPVVYNPVPQQQVYPYPGQPVMAPNGNQDYVGVRGQAL